MALFNTFIRPTTSQKNQKNQKPYFTLKPIFNNQDLLERPKILEKNYILSFEEEKLEIYLNSVASFLYKEHDSDPEYYKSLFKVDDLKEEEAKQKAEYYKSLIRILDKKKYPEESNVYNFYLNKKGSKKLKTMCQINSVYELIEGSPTTPEILKEDQILSLNQKDLEIYLNKVADFLYTQYKYGKEYNKDLLKIFKLDQYKTGSNILNFYLDEKGSKNFQKMAKMANIYFSYKDILKDSSSFGYAEDLSKEVLSNSDIPFPKEFIKKVCDFIKYTNKHKKRNYSYIENDFTETAGYLNIDSSSSYDKEDEVVEY